MRIPEVSFFGLSCQVLYIKQYVVIVTMQKLAPGHLFPAIKVGVLLEKTLQMLFFFKKLYFSQVLQYWIIRLALQLQ